MEAELMANDNALPRNKLLALATLLKEALCIERDLTGRLSQHPKQKSLLKQHKEYRQLVEQLTRELEKALASYLAKTKPAAGPGARKAMRPSDRASAISRSDKRRTRWT
jgi:hypothetical protein